MRPKHSRCAGIPLPASQEWGIRWERELIRLKLQLNVKMRFSYQWVLRKIEMQKDRHSGLAFFYMISLLSNFAFRSDNMEGGHRERNKRVQHRGYLYVLIKNTFTLIAVMLFESRFAFANVWSPGIFTKRVVLTCIFVLRALINIWKKNLMCSL